MIKLRSRKPVGRLFKKWKQRWKVGKWIDIGYILEVQFQGVSMNKICVRGYTKKRNQVFLSLFFIPTSAFFSIVCYFFSQELQSVGKESKEGWEVVSPFIVVALFPLNVSKQWTCLIFLSPSFWAFVPMHFTLKAPWPINWTLSSCLGFHDSLTLVLYDYWW